MSVTLEPRLRRSDLPPATQALRPQWTRIAAIVCVVSLILAIVLGAPIWTHHRKTVRQAEIDAAQKRYDELMETSFLGPCVPFSAEYRAATLPTMAISPESTEFSALVLPSFKPEWGLAGTVRDGVASIRVVELQESLWDSSWVPSGSGAGEQDLKVPRLGKTERTTRVSEALLGAITTEWDDSARATREPLRTGLDGTSYVLMTPTGCAEVWSPEPGTRPAQLFELITAIRRGANAEQVQSKLSAIAPLPSVSW